MSRGKSAQPDSSCLYCDKPLPSVRNPGAKYCNTLCRGRDRYQRYHHGKGIKCLDCGKVFTRVGSHVVQVHNYESVLEYRREHGLMARETHTDAHAEDMRLKAKTIDNLQAGKPHRYRVGGNQAEQIRKFWQNRERKLGTRKRQILN